MSADQIQLFIISFAVSFALLQLYRIASAFGRMADAVERVAHGSENPIITIRVQSL